MKDNYPPIYVQVTAIQGQHAYISLASQKQSDCIHCQKQSNGCQSISIYHWFFVSHPLVLPNQNYQLGQQLQLKLPPRFLTVAVSLLLGLPLLGFLTGALSSLVWGEVTGFMLGLIAAVAGFYWAKALVTCQFQRTLTILMR